MIHSTHLHDIESSELHPSAFLRVVDLSPLDDYGVGREVDPPGKGGRGDKHLYVPVSKQVLYQRSVHSCHSSMMNGKTVWQQILQFQVL